MIVPRRIRCRVIPRLAYFYFMTGLIAAGLLISLGFQARAGDSGQPFGLKKRIPWTTSRLKGSPEPPPPYRLERVFKKLSFDRPVVLANAPGTDRLFVVELQGKVYSFPNQAGVKQRDPVIDLAKHIKDFRRVYGLTFHPQFEKNRRCFLCYVVEEGDPDGTRVSEFTMSRSKPGEPPHIDPTSEKVLLTWHSGGHNGGCLKFGPEGYLYISTGDGAGAFPPDTHDTGQDVGDLLASVLRIDVDRSAGDKPYAIPRDNPFVDQEGARGEVWSYGHRNPWKMSFDAKTGDLWVGDVGWEMWEMVYRIRKGGNYGWSIVEASQSVHPERERGPTPILPPTIAHSHTEARSVTGGHVYYGKRLGKLRGAYIYGDYVTGKIWGARHDGERITWNEELVDTALQIICFGVDNAGELYVVGYDGTIHRLVKNTAAKANTNFPRKLSETGLFSSVKDYEVAPGVIPYSIRAEPWMDHATAVRHIALPGYSTLGIHTENNPQKGILRGEWKYPNNAVLMKTILLETERGHPESRRRVETQILHRNGDVWNAYNYIWNDEQTDAALQEGPGKDRTFIIRDESAPGGNTRQTWHHAGRTECLLCHTTRGGSVYGFLPEQLDRRHDYGTVADNQLRTLRHINVFEELPRRNRKRLPDPYDSQHELAQRARAYLHVNCATCHRRGGGGTAKFELLFHKSLKQNQLLSLRPSQGAFGIHSAQIVVPGDPYRSVLYYRMAKLGRGRMPYFGSSVTDEDGLRLIHDWIASLPAENKNGSGNGSTATRQLRRHQRRVLKQLSGFDSADGPQAKQLVDDLLSSTSGALLLATAIDRGQLKAPLRKTVIKTGSIHDDVQVRDVFERFLPEDQRTKRLGTVVDTAALLKRKGNAERGKAVFFRTQGVSCKNCHKIQGKGKEVGPDLSHIGKKYNRKQLLESILEPSKKIDRKYLVYLVQTSQGKVHTGLLAKKDAEAVVLKDKDGKSIRIPAGQVELMVPQNKSLMPELLLREMTARQVADLLEYLHSLK